MDGVTRPDGSYIIEAFNILRAAGAAPNFDPRSPQEVAAVMLYGTVLMRQHGLSGPEVVDLAVAHAAEPAKPGYPLSWPSPGHLLSYRRAQVPTLEAAKVGAWFDALATAAGEARALPRGDRSADEVFADRARRQLGFPLAQLPAPVLAALAEVGGRRGLADEGATPEALGFLRRRFLKAVQAAEERERLSPAPVDARQSAPVAPQPLLTDGGEVGQPIDFAERVRALRERLASRRSMP